MLKVARNPRSYSETAKKWHLIKTKRWGGASRDKIMTLQIKYFCEEKESDRTPTKFNRLEMEDFDKAVHMKNLCEDCLKNIREYTKNRGAQAKPSHQ